MFQLKPIEWSEEKEPSSLVRYNHIIGKHLIGEFTIEWKKWKEDNSYCLYGSINDYFEPCSSVKEAKRCAQTYIDNLIMECIIQ